MKNADSLLADEFFVLYGDSYLFLDFVAVMLYFKKFDKLGLMTVYKNYDRYDISNVSVINNLIKEYSKNKKTRDMVYIDYGASIFRKKALDLVPANQVYSLEELTTQLVKQEQMLAYEVSERFYQIGSFNGLKEFERYVLESGLVL